MGWDCDGNVAMSGSCILPVCLDVYLWDDDGDCDCIYSPCTHILHMYILHGQSIALYAGLLSPNGNEPRYKASLLQCKETSTQGARKWMRSSKQLLQSISWWDAELGEPKQEHGMDTCPSPASNLSQTLFLKVFFCRWVSFKKYNLTMISYFSKLFLLGKVLSTTVCMHISRNHLKDP